jgi:GNAT superfamily N-acetyltransferase
MTSAWTPRIARESDIPALERLIPASARALQAPYYTQAQIEAALGPVFGVDRQLIRDSTYFVVDQQGEILGAGGWSKRKSLYGGDQGRAGPDPELDPDKEPARIRAFFVHPLWARRGIGRAILAACEEAAWRHGFRQTDLVATLAGVPLYGRFGYEVIERYEIPLRDGLRLPVARMTRIITK